MSDRILKILILLTYNGMLDADAVIGAWERYQNKDLNNEVLICYGYGDGGGGPTRQMLECLRVWNRE